jgi:ribosomal protein S18 acetylase RimI-like enzyme
LLIGADAQVNSCNVHVDTFTFSRGWAKKLTLHFWGMGKFRGNDGDGKVLRNLLREVRNDNNAE